MPHPVQRKLPQRRGCRSSTIASDEGFALTERVASSAVRNGQVLDLSGLIDSDPAAILKMSHYPANPDAFFFIALRVVTRVRADGHLSPLALVVRLRADCSVSPRRISPFRTHPETDPTLVDGTRLSVRGAETIVLDPRLIPQGSAHPGSALVMKREGSRRNLL